MAVGGSWMGKSAQAWWVWHEAIGPQDTSRLQVAARWLVGLDDAQSCLSKLYAVVEQHLTSRGGRAQ